MQKLIRAVFFFGPLIFGFGFLAPLIAQSLIFFGYAEFAGLPALQWGLLIGGLYGLLAQLTGRWL